MKIILYTTHCPQCTLLERVLNNNKLEFESCEDTKEMLSKGMMSVPMLEVDGVIMNFQKALAWINGGKV